MISPAFRPPQLAKYQLIEEIGHGGMATVYRARDMRLERDVAVKLLHRHLRESAEVKVRFASEARAVAKLRHPNIVEVFDVSDEDEIERYLVVELVRGVTLRQLLRDRKEPLPPELAAEIVAELCGALEHAHEEGVIHRDIKPENVLIELPQGGARSSIDDLERPRVKLTDFGIAKLLDSEGVTSTGQVLGSPAHMAPEQIEGRAVDARADVFSLGVLFYECIVGQLPFAGKNPAQVLRNVLEGNFTAADVAQPRVGAVWGRLLTRALQREPEDRYASIAELLVDVRDELKRLGFERPRQDISEFLTNPVQYTTRHEGRIVGALMHSATAARQDSDVARASADYSRALCYKPGDPALLSAVSHLRRRSRRRSTAIVVLSVFGVALVGWLVIPRVIRPSEAVVDEPTVLVNASTTAARDINASGLQNTAPANSGMPISVASAAAFPSPAVSEPARPAGGGSGVSTAPRSPRPVASAEEVSNDVKPVMRRVSVRITGAGGAAVKIDGNEVAWFGAVHELTVGRHTFEFLPPNESCCSATSRLVDIPDGEGVFVVVGSVPFRDAVVALRASDGDGLVVSCPTLFAGAMRGVGRRSIPMSEAEVSGSCVVSSTSEGTQQIVLTLRAGQTTNFP
jgi:eukaryotic-like serine/threonine-protein kinase